MMKSLKTFVFSIIVLMTLTFCANLALELLGTHNLELQAAADDEEAPGAGVSLLKAEQKTIRLLSSLMISLKKVFLTTWRKH